MDQGAQQTTLSLLSFQMVWLQDGIIHKHMYNFCGEDVKQDAYLTWACFVWIFENRV